MTDSKFSVTVLGPEDDTHGIPEHIRTDETERIVLPSTPPPSLIDGSRGTAQQREHGAYGRWQASRYADDPNRAAAFDLGCDCHYLEGDTHHDIGCPSNLARLRSEMRKSGPNSVTVMNLDTGDVVSRSTPASRAADSRARVTLLMDRDDYVRGVYASQDQAEAERDKRNDDPSCTDSPYSTKTWNVDATADSQAAGGEPTAKVSPTSDEFLEAIVPLLTEKHNEAVRLRVALERIYALLSSTGATPEADRTLSIEAANIANVALRWKP